MDRETRADKLRHVFGPTGHQTLASQFLIPVENDLAHVDGQTITKATKRGGAEVAEEIAEFLSGILMPSWGLTAR